ncbi:T9SS type A sorting domain-containing protein [Chitinophaga sp. 22620]|uniref:T9SS type A sorting domain-containing protein n=1 Tax=Chitinophaga sp. 22620 TaxID=3453952 RepID=UPI003F851E2A
MHAQSGIFIPPGADIMAYKADTVSIFGNMDNRGRFGSAVGSVVLFYGQQWSNTEGASLPDERFYHPSAPANGGIFRFMQPQDTSATTQYVFGGYSASGNAGASFPNLSINNTANVQLADLSDISIRHNLHFESGHIILNGWNISVGDDSPGSITGYSHQRFIVTGSTPYGGYLYRKQASAANGQLVFPVGSGAGSYTPLALRYSGTTADNFAARVFDNVLSHAQTGSILQSNRVLKTWHVRQARPQSGAETIVWLQHNPPEQDAGFAQNTDSSFITRFIVPTGWDTVSPAGFTRPGNFTTGMPLTEALVHTRSFTGSGHLFLSLLTYSKPPAPRFQVSLIFDAFRKDIRWVQTSWLTLREQNVQHFELERRRENESSFRTVAVIPSQTPTGNSQVNRSYQHVDDNYYDNWSYYRLKTVSRNGDSAYSPIRAVPNYYQITVSPNPNRGTFNVSLFGIRNLLRIEMYDMSGRLAARQQIAGNNTPVSVPNLAAGMYILVFYDTDNNHLIIDRQKIEIIK